jgi:hypothetical protein
LTWKPKTKEYILAAACSDGSAHILNFSSTLDQQTMTNEEPSQQLSVTTTIFPLDSNENSEVWKHSLFILCHNTKHKTQNTKQQQQLTRI